MQFPIEDYSQVQYNRGAGILIIGRAGLVRGVGNFSMY